jgi:hypothetical protein
VLMLAKFRSDVPSKSARQLTQEMVLTFEVFDIVVVNVAS